MSASYWTSTQKSEWQMTKPELNQLRTTNSTHVDPNIRIYIYFHIMKLGRRINVRQVCISTAHVYVARFLNTVTLNEVNLYLLITTAIYLACKVEEQPQHIRSLVNEARALWPEYIPPDPTKITELEFYLIEELSAYLIVHHPYKSLWQCMDALRTHGLEVTPDEVHQIWSVCNDSYVTDLPLTVAPYIIALSCTAMILVSHGKPVDGFLASCGVDLHAVHDAIQQLFSMYESWEKYSELKCKSMIHKLYS